MKFATAIRDFSRSKGGAERYVVDLCSRMAQEGFEVHVYAEKWDEEIAGIFLHQVKTLPFPKSLRLLSFAIRATRGMKKGDYDVTLGVGNTLEADVLQPHGGVHWAWFWRSLKAYDHPILWMIKLLGRILSPKQWASGWIEDRPYKRGNYSRIVAISDMVKKDIFQRYKVPEDRIALVYNGVDINRFHPRNHQYRGEIRKKYGFENEKIILFVSNNFRMKGLSFLIKALAQVKGEGSFPLKLLILGRDHQAPYLRLAEKLGLSEEVVFAGNTDEPQKYYGAADLLVHPTFYDACSLTVLEALASGLPVITTSSNGASGIITQGKEGFILLDPRDKRTLAERISFYLNDDNRAKASIAARELAEKYSNERNWEEMKGVIERTVSRREAVP
jgi:UDP-glucose:(heptosyl)LPS alpha-1,3-glucosyltransferase